MHEIVHELTIAAPPKAVFDAITSESGLTRWWTSSATLDGEGGSGTTIRVADRGELMLRVDLVESPEVVHWECVDGPTEWVGTTVAFRIEPVEAVEPTETEQPAEAGPPAATSVQSLVRFWHGGWPYADGALPRASFDWAMALDSLRRYVETGTATGTSR